MHVILRRVEHETSIHMTSYLLAGTALDMHRAHRDRLNNQSKYLSTGDSALDKCLHGGLAIGSLVEVCGTPGIGKVSYPVWNINIINDLVSSVDTVLFDCLC